MSSPDTVGGSRILRGSANGHDYVALVARDEPRRERARALSDLEAALPSPATFAQVGAKVEHLATTPDFHPGKPVPVGVVLRTRGAILPHVVGSDIGCSMRLLVLRGIRREDVLLHARGIAQHMRHMLFQGGRDVALTGYARRAALVHGLPGFLDEIRSGSPGLLGRMDDAAHNMSWREGETVVHRKGACPARGARRWRVLPMRISASP